MCEESIVRTYNWPNLTLLMPWKFRPTEYLRFQSVLDQSQHSLLREQRTWVRMVICRSCSLREGQEARRLGRRASRARVSFDGPGPMVATGARRRGPYKLAGDCVGHNRGVWRSERAVMVMLCNRAQSRLMFDGR